MLSQNAIENIKEAIAKYPRKKSASMDALMIAQKECGHLTQDVLLEIASLLEMPPVQLNQVAAFYTMYNKKPIGKHHVQVCTNVSCSLLGSEHIVEFLSKKLGVNKGETTSDKKFTLSEVECLGSCGTAPMMQINNDYYENLTEAKIEEILKGLP
ncbi:MAG: NADH-quinone oxidoreductase subunit NuoE [Deltaproteobacteria bacterium]|nr:NADH-quinone oxidoreductase subunit NuoE [Deltaproteobacteria bacterium]